MCTLYFRFHPEDDYPLALLANRDELLGRPAEGWAWRKGKYKFLAPMDMEAGGTWIGVNEHGLLVALTNIIPPTEYSGVRSRGLLVTDMLGLQAASAAPESMEAEMSGYRYNDCNLLVADQKQAWAFSWTRGELISIRLAPGIYEMVNIPYKGQKLDEFSGSNKDWFEARGDYLKKHPNICKHGAQYGTRCSHKLLIPGNNLSNLGLWHLDGNPCETEYEDLSRKMVNHGH